MSRAPCQNFTPERRRPQDAPPVWVAAPKAVFTSGRSRNSFRDAFRSCFRLGAAHFDFDHALGAFAVGHDLQRQRAATPLIQRGSECAMGRDVPALIEGGPPSPLARTSKVSFVEVSHPR